MKLSSHNGNQYRSSLETENKITLWLKHATIRYINWRNLSPYTTDIVACFYWLLLYCCSKTSWPRQLIKRRYLTGLQFQKVIIVYGGRMKAWQLEERAKAKSSHLNPQAGNRETNWKWWVFWTLKVQPQWHTYNKTTPSNPVQIALATRGQVFKYISLWKQLSFKSSHSTSWTS